MKRLLPAILVIAVWAALSVRLPPILLPSPLAVLEKAWEARAQLAGASIQTGVSALAGLALASALGLGGAVAFTRSRWLEDALAPWALLLQTVPVVAVAPLLVVWLGYGRPVSVATAAIVSFFPILTATTLGLRSADPAQVELLRLYGASWWQELRMLRAPGALPAVLSGYRTAVGLGVIGAIVGEFVGSNGQPACLGFVILFSARSAETALTFAAIAVSTGLALGLFGVVRLVERLTVARWHASAS